MLLDDVCRNVGSSEWLDRFCRVDAEGKVTLLLGKEWVYVTVCQQISYSSSQLVSTYTAL